MTARGGQPVRHRRLDGRDQFWVVDQSGKVITSTRLDHLACALGLRPTMNDNQWITTARAATLTGYSPGRILHATKELKLETRIRPGKGKAFLIPRDAIVAWSESQRAKGGLSGPRRGPKTARTLRVTQTPRTPPGRLTAYLKTLVGTPLEMTAEEFTERVIRQALDRLKA